LYSDLSWNGITNQCFSILKLFSSESLEMSAWQYNNRINEEILFLCCFRPKNSWAEGFHCSRYVSKLINKKPHFLSFLQILSSQKNDYRNFDFLRFYFIFDAMFLIAISYSCSHFWGKFFSTQTINKTM